DGDPPTAVEAFRAAVKLERSRGADYHVACAELDVAAALEAAGDVAEAAEIRAGVGTMLDGLACAHAVELDCPPAPALRFARDTTAGRQDAPSIDRPRVHRLRRVVYYRRRHCGRSSRTESLQARHAGRRPRRARGDREARQAA